MTLQMLSATATLQEIEKALALTTPESLAESQSINSKVDDRPDFLDGSDAILRGCMVPELYRTWKLDAFNSIPPVAWSRGGVLITGATGTGKSCLAAALLRSRLKPDHYKTLAVPSAHGAKAKYDIPGTAALWRRCGEILISARGAFRDGAMSEGEIIGAAIAPRLLVLDDLCSGKMTDAGWMILSEIVACRVERMKDTVVTTNLTLSEIHAEESRLASRLGALEEIRLTGPDYRNTKA